MKMNQAGAGDPIAMERLTKRIEAADAHLEVPSDIGQIGKETLKPSTGARLDERASGPMLEGRG